MASDAAPKFTGPVPNSDEAIGRRYNYHPPIGNQAQRYGEIRDKLAETAKYCRDRSPMSPEQTRAFNALDEAMFLFNAAIARNEPRDIPQYTTTEITPTTDHHHVRPVI